MKKLALLTVFTFIAFTSFSKVHTFRVWDGYYSFYAEDSQAIIELGDTIQWLPLDVPTMVHTITSSSIPNGADEFDQIWKAPADTFFQYIPKVVGHYNYVCTPHEFSHNMVGEFDVVAKVTDVTEVEITQVQLYPNPSHHIISLSGSTEDTSFVILSSTGAIIKEGIAQGYSIDISDLPKGIYVLKLQTETANSISFQKN